MLTLMALLPAALFGGLIGFVLVDLVGARQGKAVKWVGGGGVLLVVMIPLGIVLFPYIMSVLPSPPPSRADDRAAWAQWMGQTPGPVGAELAERLRGCLGATKPSSGEALLAHGCEVERRRWQALGPDKRQELGAYNNTDDGWRWDLIESAGQRRLVVFPDSMLRQSGPTFEVGQYETVRHDAPKPRGPPQFATDSTLPRVARFRECVRRRAAELRQAGTWSGLGESLPPLLQTSAPDSTGCPGVGIYESAQGPLQPWGLQVRDAERYPLRVEYRAVFDGSVDTPFELSVMSNRIGYMIDRHGQWHTRAEGRPIPEDPPPDPCFIDLSIACQ
jgi:hypothetical protein